MLPKSIFTFLLFFSLSFAENITINNIFSYSISSIHSTKPLDESEGHATMIAEFTPNKNECLKAIKSVKDELLPVSIIVTDDFYIIKYNHSSNYYPKKDFVITFTSLPRPLNSSDFCPDNYYKWK